MAAPRKEPCAHPPKGATHISKTLLPTPIEKHQTSRTDKQYIFTEVTEMLSMYHSFVLWSHHTRTHKHTHT
jgi:hypothetical protein